MNIITRHEGYEYASLTLVTTFLVPQIYSGYRSGSLKDVSAASLWFVFFGSALWGNYMIENDLIYFSVPTFFVTLCSLITLIMKLKFYYKRVDEHFTSFDKPSGPPTFRIEKDQTQV